MSFPPGPAGAVLFGCLSEIRRDPLAFLERLTVQFGDISHFRLARFHVFLLNHPDDIEQVLVTHHHRFVKGRSLQGVRRLFGLGLLTSDGALHDRQRHLIQPAFHRVRIEDTAHMITSAAIEHRERWSDGETIDVAGEMSRLTLAIAARALFGTDGDRVLGPIGDVLSTVGLLDVPELPFGPLTDLLLRGQGRQLREARKTLDGILEDLIERRRRDSRGDGDLLGALLSAQDAARGEGLSEVQLRDELITLLLAAHDTTANALAWTWYLLARHPDVETRLHGEIDAALGARRATANDLPALPFAKAVFAESMRLYPPAWLLARVAQDNHRAQGYLIPARSLVVLSPWAVHRNPAYFPEPLRFDPGRWLLEEHRLRPRFSYFPFGGGARGCLGEAFAWTEGVLLISMIAQRWQFRLPDAALDPQPHPGLTLSPKNGIRVRCWQRTSG